MELVRVADVVLSPEIVDSVGFRLPAAVKAVNIATARAEDRDRPHHVDPPRIDKAADLHDLVRGAPDENVEECLACLCDGGGRILPVAKYAGAVAAEVDAAQWNARALEVRQRRQQKIVVE